MNKERKLLLDNIHAKINTKKTELMEFIKNNKQNILVLEKMEIG